MLELKDFKAVEIIEEKIKNCVGGNTCTGGEVFHAGTQHGIFKSREVYSVHDGDNVNDDGVITYKNQRVVYGEWYWNI